MAILGYLGAAVRTFLSGPSEAKAMLTHLPPTCLHQTQACAAGPGGHLPLRYRHTGTAWFGTIGATGVVAHCAVRRPLRLTGDAARPQHDCAFRWKVRTETQISRDKGLYHETRLPRSASAQSYLCERRIAPP